MSKKVVVTPVRTLTPDSMSTVGVDVNIHIPEKAFTGRTRLIVVPQLLQKDSMLAEYTPMVFDAPIYSKKMNRRVLLDGYVDTLANVARKVLTADALWPYFLPTDVVSVVLPIP